MKTKVWGTLIILALGSYYTLAEDKKFVRITNLMESILYGNQKGAIFERDETKVAAPLRADRIESFAFNGGKVKDVRVIYKKYMSAKLEGDKVPWSGPIWGSGEGNTNNRYESSEYRGAGNFNEKIFFTTKNTAQDAEGDAIDELSPNEKLDLIIGGDAVHKRGWEYGLKILKKKNRFSGFSGMCHAWSFASLIWPRPKHPIKIRAADKNVIVTLYPADLMGIATTASNDYFTSNYKILGEACDLKQNSITRDSTTGRIMDPKCFDVNPRDLLLGVVNQIAIAKAPLTVDNEYNYSYWNWPVFGYKINWYNPNPDWDNPNPEKPKIKMLTDNINEAVIYYKDFKPIDKLYDIRKQKYKEQNRDFDAEVKYVVGVVLDLNYVHQRTASHFKLSSLKDDSEGRHRRLRYRFDLEINEKFEVIGGEWQLADNVMHPAARDLNGHPDYLAMPNKGEKAFYRADHEFMKKVREGLYSGSDYQLQENARVPERLRKMARGLNGRVSGVLIEQLFKLSNQKE